MESTDDIISKIKMIGKINPDDKISVRGMYIQKRGLITSFSRTLINNDNRENTLTFLINTIKKAFEILSHYYIVYEKDKKAGDKLMFINLLTDIKNAKTGLYNLKDTYDSDIMFCCKIETLIQEIDAKLIEYQNNQELE